MARKRGYRKRTQRKRRGVKRRHGGKRNKATMTMVRSPGFSDQCFVKLKYSQDIHIYDGASASKYYTFRGNSLYDPDLSGVGHQPLYFDQYALIYSKYRVLGAKITLRAINGQSSVAQYLVLESGTEQNISNNLTRLLEQSRGAIAKLVPASSQGPTYIKKYCSTRKACGLTKSQMSDQDYAADTNASPTQLWYFNLVVTSIDSLSPCDLYMMVSLVYYVQFYDRMLMNQS